MPLIEMTAISVVPPPMSTTIVAEVASIGSRAPIAAAMACSTRKSSLARAIRRVLHGALFHRSDFARDANDNSRMHQHAPIVSLLDEIGQHLFGDFEVRDDTVFHRLDGDDVARRASEHLFCFAADSHDFSAGLVDGHDRGLV